MIKPSRWKLVAVSIWLAFTLTLSGWWLIFGLRQIDLISHLQNAEATLILRQHRMLVLEGSVLLALLLIGGLALIYYIIIETKRAFTLQKFFAAFTHDLKTSLASMRLQGEALEEDLKNSEHSRLLRRLVKDQVRLELQLENSLFIANPENLNLYVETLPLAATIQSMAAMWSELKVETQGDALINVDSRAFESIVKNLLQNSFVHGRATQVTVSTQPHGTGFVKIRIQDNGSGFKGERKKLAQAFYRHSSTSGSGIGLHLAQLLVKQMGGSLQFETPKGGGFVAEFILKGQSV